MDDRSNRYPLDVTKLVPGQTLTVVELETVLGFSQQSNPGKFSMRTMWLKRIINRDRMRSGLPTLTMCTHKGDLVLLSGYTASLYSQKKCRNNLRTRARHLQHLVDVDTTDFTPDQLRQHEHAIRRNVMISAAVRDARHAPMPKLPAPERATPRMISAQAGS